MRQNELGFVVVNNPQHDFDLIQEVQYAIGWLLTYTKWTDDGSSHSFLPHKEDNVKVYGNCF